MYGRHFTSGEVASPLKVMRSTDVPFLGQLLSIVIGGRRRRVGSHLTSGEGVFPVPENFQANWQAVMTFAQENYVLA